MFCDIHYAVFLSAYNSEALRHANKSDAARMIKKICGYMVPLKTKKGQALFARRLVAELQQGAIYDW
jgi:hypothetical protein